MDDKEFNSELYTKLMEIHKEHIQMKDNLINLHKFDNQKVFDHIKMLREKKEVIIPRVLNNVNLFGTANIKYLRKYWELYKQIYDFYKPELKDIDKYSLQFQALYNNTYKIDFNASINIPLRFNFKDNPYANKTTEEILELHPEGTILRLILDDNISKLQDKILEEKIDISMECNELSLLQWCAKYGSLKCFRFFRSEGLKIDEKCFELSFFGRNNEIIQECEQYCKKPTVDILNAAIRTGELSLLMYYIQKYNMKLSELSYYTMQSFFYILCSEKDLAQYYRVATIFGIPTLIDSLIDNGFDLFKNPADCVIFLGDCIAYRDIEFCEYLIKKGLDVNAFTYDLISPLNLAIAHFDNTIAKLLIEKGVDINRTAGEHRTPLEMSLSVKNVEMAKLLLDKGADVKIGYPLHRCAMHDDLIDIFKIIVEKGADINYIDENQMNPLRINILSRSEHKIAKYLLQIGANVDDSFDTYLIHKFMKDPENEE